jgi:hypothetical protein
VWATTHEQGYGCSPWWSWICSHNAVQVLRLWWWISFLSVTLLTSTIKMRHLCNSRLIRLWVVQRRLNKLTPFQAGSCFLLIYTCKTCVQGLEFDVFLNLAIVARLPNFQIAFKNKNSYYYVWHDTCLLSYSYIYS